MNRMCLTDSPNKQDERREIRNANESWFIIERAYSDGDEEQASSINGALTQNEILYGKAPATNKY